MEEKEFVKMRVSELWEDIMDAVDFESVPRLFWAWAELHSFLKQHMSVVKNEPEINSMVCDMFNMTAIAKKEFMEFKDEINDVAVDRIKVNFNAVEKWFEKQNKK